MARRSTRLLVPLAVLPLAACTPGTAPDATSVEPIQIDTVVVSVDGPAPASVRAHVTGVVGDGCAELLPERQSRSGSRVVIVIERERPLGAICTQIARLYDRVLRVEGRFAAGNYALRVNDSETSFAVP